MKSLWKVLALTAILVTGTVLGLRPVQGVHAAGTTVLILSTSVTGGASSLEAQAALSQGFSVQVVTPTAWAAMTTSNFASYRAIILGDPTCGTPSSPYIGAAEANTSVWTPAVRGPVVVIGTDPVYHVTYGANAAGAAKLIDRGIAYATGNYYTGAYIDLSCYYWSNTPFNTPVPVLNGFGSFTVVGQSNCGCDTNNAVVVSSPPFLSAVTSANLSGWGASIHELFDSYPSSFSPFAVSASNFQPYILTRHSTRCIPGIACY
jgi:hypothetical protein